MTNKRIEELLEEAEEREDDNPDSSDPETINKQRKKASRTRADRLKFVNAAMQHPEGRSWFYDILDFCHVLNRSFDPDPYVHAFKAGEVNVGMRLLADVQEAAGDNYLKMLSENKRK